MNSELKRHMLEDLAKAYRTHALRVNPEYQRGTKWTSAQKQGLIDSLLRGYQIPLFYVHLIQNKNPFTKSVETTAMLVDGQQRLAAIVAFLQNEFALPNPREATRGTALPVITPQFPAWSGKKFAELMPEDAGRLLATELLVVEMSEHAPNEARDLFIRLQAGTPLTAQEKRDAWPGNFTLFVIRHAGKPGHPHSNPKRFFGLFPRSRGLTVDDGDHYVDGLAECRKFFAGLAMTIMVRERSGDDFVDLKGKILNEFYMANLDLKDDDPGASRVIRVLDAIAQLRGFDSLRDGKPMSFQWAFHLALLVDSLMAGDYVPLWREDVVAAFTKFQADAAEARLHYKQTKESLPHYERFVRLLGGSGSDTADVIRSRHAFLLSEVYSKIRITARDPNRCFGIVEKEVIWNRDRGKCQSPDCSRPGCWVPFRDATIHHVIEHSAGGQTIITNGVLVCPECHFDRLAMQRLTSHFQAYLQGVYAKPGPDRGEVGTELPYEADVEQVGQQGEREASSTGRAEGRLRVVIDWGALDVDRESQTICENRASASVAKLLGELISTFGKPMEKQLMEFEVLRYPLSREPSVDFVNRTTGEPYGALPVPGTDLYFCPLSSSSEKVRRLSSLFSRLTLPDGRGFPPASVEIQIDTESPVPDSLL